MIAYSIAAVFVLCLGILVERAVKFRRLLREMNNAVNSYYPMEM